MSAEREPRGWAWFEPAEAAPGDDDEAELCRAFARCLSGPDGERVMRHLERVVLDRRLPPEASDTQLRHLEGQRYAVAYIAAMAARGRA